LIGSCSLAENQQSCLIPSAVWSFLRS
jgi:hypothetical protein